MGFKMWRQVGVWVTLFSKLPYLREFLNIWFQKSTDIRYKRSLSTIFWKFQKAISIWVLVGGFNFRLCTYKVPPGSSDSAPKPEAEGRVWWDGLDGWDGISKGSFNFLQTLWEYRTCIYILVYKIKVAANILMGFKIWCQVGVWVTLFSKLPYSREFSNIWFQKLTDIRYKRSLWTTFWKSQKSVSIWVLVWGFNFRLAPTMSNPYLHCSSGVQRLSIYTTRREAPS